MESESEFDGETNSRRQNRASKAHGLARGSTMRPHNRA